MLKAITDNKVASALLTAYIIAMTGGVITSTIVNFGQDTKHVAEVERSKGVDVSEAERTTLAIKLALEARDMAVANGAVVGIFHDRDRHGN